MKFLSPIILVALPLSIWANEPMESNNTVTPAGVNSIETESEFTGNPIVDEADAGNTEKTSSEVASTDTDSEADSTDNEPEMSQEEADAELAADMNAADSATVDSLQKLSLDMTTAFVPSAMGLVIAAEVVRDLAGLPR